MCFFPTRFDYVKSRFSISIISCFNIDFLQSKHLACNYNETGAVNCLLLNEPQKRKKQKKINNKEKRESTECCRLLCTMYIKYSINYVQNRFVVCFFSRRQNVSIKKRKWTIRWLFKYKQKNHFPFEAIQYFSLL